VATPTPGTPRTLLDREIDEQPEAVARLLDREDDAVARVAAALRRAGVRTVTIAARGSSDNAARYAQYLLGVRHRLPVGLAAPSLVTRYGAPPRLHGGLAVGLSQSGRSPDIVAVLEAARADGSPTLAITNDTSSPLAGVADHVVALHAGAERSVAATKTYVTSLAALALLSAHLGGGGDLVAGLRAVPDLLARAIAGARAAVDALADPAPLASTLTVGRGYNYATAFEVALKIRELTGGGAVAYSSADLLHGPVASVGPGSPVLLVAPTGVVSADLAELAGSLRDRGARLAVIADDPALLAAADDPLPLPPGTPEELSPLVAVVPGQLLAARLAAAAGIDVDRPLGLAKVTETY